MPDQDQIAGFSRVCPSCGRRVPRSVLTCRCGVELPDEQLPPEPAEAQVEEEPRRSALLGLLVLAAILGGAGYWMFLRPPPPDAEVTEEVAEETEEEEPDADEPDPDEPVPSAEARAWTATAGASAGTPRDFSDSSAPISSRLSASIEEMVDRVMPAVVLIETTTGKGSGFFVSSDTLVTNQHVVQNDGYVTIRKHDGSTLNARVASRAPAFDIAILKVQSSASQTFIPMGSAQSLRAGQEIIVIGSALGTLQNSVSRGIVSGLRTSGGATLVQTDAATNPGNSGGPMLDRNGSVVGITTMGYKGAQGLNFGVAIEHARDLLEGRQTGAGISTGLSAIQTRPQEAESDRRQRLGEDQFRAQMAQAVSAARSIDTSWQRFRGQCFTSAIKGNYDREWFSVLSPGGLPDEAGNGCTTPFKAMESDILQFQAYMRLTMSDARRASVLPGTVRDAMRANRLDFDWER